MCIYCLKIDFYDSDEKKMFHFCDEKTKIKTNGLGISFLGKKYLDRPIVCVGIEKYGLRSLVLFLYNKNIVPI
jgi:hypothetical protein